MVFRSQLCRFVDSGKIPLSVVEEWLRVRGAVRVTIHGQRGEALFRKAGYATAVYTDFIELIESHDVEVRNGKLFFGLRTIDLVK